MKTQGMYHGDVRDGEGVLTYPGGRQDVGTWEGTKLVKLRFTVKEAYFDPASRDLPLKSPEENSLGSSNSEERAGFGPKGQLEVHMFITEYFKYMYNCRLHQRS